MQRQFDFVSPSSKLVVRKCIQNFSRCKTLSSVWFKWTIMSKWQEAGLLHGHSYQTANFHSSPARSTENARGSSALLPLFDFKVQQRLHDDDLSLLYHSQRFPLSLTLIVFWANFGTLRFTHLIQLSTHEPFLGYQWKRFPICPIFRLAVDLY